MARPEPVGLGPEDPRQLADRAPCPGRADGGRVHLAPAELDGRDHRLGVEHGERCRHHLAGHLAHDRAPAREVGRHRPAAARRRRATLGWAQTPVRRRPHGTPGRSTPGRPPVRGPWRGVWSGIPATRSQLPPYAGGASPYRLIRGDARTNSAWLRPSPGPVEDAPGRGRDVDRGARRRSSASSSWPRWAVSAALIALASSWSSHSAPHFRGSSVAATGPGATRNATRTSSSPAASWSRRLSVVPYGRMQFVEVTAGPDRAALPALDGQAAHRGGGQRRPHSRARAEPRRPGSATG